MRTCKDCLNNFPIESFPMKRSEGRVYPTTRCRACYRAYIRVAALKCWHKKSEEHRQNITRNRHLKECYGITLEDYKKMLMTQDGRCAVCGTDDPTTDGYHKQFSVDHCHKTKRVRGLLCNPCNRGIGLLKDNAEALKKAAEYVSG